MVNWTGVVVPIVVAILALLGTLVVALVNNYIQSLNKPKIEVIVEPEGSTSLVNIANDGLAPATNLSLIIKTFNDTQVTKKFGAVDVIAPQLPKIPNLTTSQTLNLTVPTKIATPGSYLELRIPNLPHGEGSLTQIEVTGNGTSDYKSVAVFDQGSSMGRGPLSPEDEIDRIFSFFGGYDYFLAYYSLASFYVVIIAIVFSIRRRKRFLFKKFISSIRDQMTDIHNSSEEDQETKKNIHTFIETWKNKTPNLKRYQYTFFRPSIKVVDYLNMKDYIITENLYKKLLKNPLYLEEHLNPEDKKRYNNHCRRLVEDALISIDWKKYL
jgi:hypothetical protein